MIFKFLTPLAFRVILGVILAIALIFAGLQWKSARNARTEARLSEGQAGAVTESAVDAIGTVGAVSGRDTATDDLTRTSNEAIRNAPGADAAVDAGVHGAGLQAICKRAAYRDDPRCAG